MKKVFFLALALVSAFALNAKTVYLHTSAWEDGGCNKFAVWQWADGGDGSWTAFMTKSEEHVYTVDVTEANLLFVRFNPEAAAPAWNSGEGDNTCWGQTCDLKLADGEHYTPTMEWDSECNGFKGSWGEGGGQQGGGGQGGGSSTPDAYWYYKGYIDGGDLENEAGGFNIFNCGTAHLDVASDAYLFVMFQKKGVQGVQYMTTAYVDGPTHATMVTTGGEKMHVGAGSYTLYLYDNGDGSVELSTEQLSGKTLVKENCNASTNIQLVVEKLDLNAPMYDVLGRKVNADYHGIVIQNGKKFIR